MLIYYILGQKTKQALLFSVIDIILVCNNDAEHDRICKSD
jgi:hypothetical protein